MDVSLKAARTSAKCLPSTGRQGRGTLAEALQRPINRGAADDLPHPGPAGFEGESAENHAANQVAPQPDGIAGVTGDMASLALNPAQLPSAELHSADLERLAKQSAANLHVSGDFGDMDDAAIMLELKAGNMAGFDFLLNKYRKPIINFMYRMTRNQAVAEELAQEVFLRVYRSRETYRAEARFSTWLYRIATNLGVNHARDTRHERSASTVYLDETDSETGTTPDVADTTPGVESALLRDERMAAIRDLSWPCPSARRWPS